MENLKALDMRSRFFFFFFFPSAKYFVFYVLKDLYVQDGSLLLNFTEYMYSLFEIN